MAKIQLKGLDGLRGLSGDEYTRWRNAQVSAGKITSRTSYAQEEALYNNQQYIAKYGLEAFESKSYEDRMNQWAYDIVQPAFYEAFNPFFGDDENNKGANGELYDANKGMGRDFFKYNLMSPEAKRQLLESNWLTKSEIDSKISKEQSDNYHMMSQPLFAGSEAGSAAVFSYNMLGKDLEEHIDRRQNDKLIESIWAKDLKKKTNELAPVVDQYYSETISKLSDDEVKSNFMKAIKPAEGQGAAYIYSAYFNDDGTPNESEVDKFSIDEMRQFLAKKAVYDYYLGPEAGYDALNNQGKEYINDHQSTLTYLGLLAKDIGISTASYTADKWNSARRLTLIGRHSDVFLTNNGEVVPTADVKNDGNTYYYEKDGKVIPVHKQTLSLTALDDMGKDGNGEDIGWFNNAQFWTNAEQFGTMDEEELAQYKKLGYSPYKVVYKPGDESDIWYETIKMTSFGLADMASNFIPAGGITLGANMLTKAANMTGMAAKAMSYTGKVLYYTSKATQKVQPIVGALAIGNAYGRGVYGETFAGNMQRLEESVADQAQREVYTSYNEDAEYRAQVDAEIEQRYQELKSQNGLEQGPDGTYTGRLMTDESMREQAKSEVLQRKANEWADNFKNSNTFGRALQEASESATDAALTSSLTTAAKYTVVNYGWRRYLFKTPSELASSYKKSAISGVSEEINAAGKKRLTSKFDFATSSERARELAKTVSAQMWGGAWTNATDELQSAGGRQINEDRMNQFLSGMYDGRALDTNYSAMSAVSSYFRGAAGALAEGNTYRAGLVGGLGSITSYTPNLTSLVTTKNFRETWRSASFGEKVNMVLANGVLNEYYAKKQGQMQLMSVVDLVNRMLDEHQDFEDIDKSIALDMADIDATNPEDKAAIQYLKGVQAINLLNHFKEDKEAAQVGRESTVLAKAMDTIDKLSVIGTEKSKATEEEVNDYLAQYYAANPTVAQSEQQNQIALEELRTRANNLKEASQTWSEIEDKLSKVEKGRGTSIPNAVRGRLLQRLTLDKFLTKRAGELESRITGSETYSLESTIESYGNTESQEAFIGTTKHHISTVEKRIEEAQKALDKAQHDMDEYKNNPHEDVGFVERNRLQSAIDNSGIQLEYLNNVKRNLNLQLDRFGKEVPTAHDTEGNVVQTKVVANTSDRVLSSDEILRLSPQDRARMLDKNNYKNYSDEQKVEIDKLRNELTVKDPSLLDDIANQAYLISMLASNKEATARILENPEAAAYQFDSDRDAQLKSARGISLERIARSIDDVITKARAKSPQGEDPAEISRAIYRNLRVLNPAILEYLKEDEGLSYFAEKEIDDAIYWSYLLSDIANSVDRIEELKDNENYKRDFSNHIDRILDKVDTIQGILDELGTIVEAKDISDSVKAPYIELLNRLEELWSQRAATTTTTREERQESQGTNTQKQQEEEKRAQEAEDAARKAAELDAAGISEADADPSNDKEAELAAQGLSGKDVTTNNEATLSPEQVAQAVAEGEDVDLESPSLEEQVVATPDQSKVDIIPAPTNDGTDQGNNITNSDGSTLLGNSMYGYEVNPLKYQGKQVPRKGASPTDKMSRYFKWLEDAGIKLQDIIDTELGDIMKLNPDVFPLFVKVEKNATNDDAMSDFPLLAVEYTPQISRIHNDRNGGVVTSNGKQYLIVGTLGFQRGNQAQGQMVREIINSPRKAFFDAHPSERFFAYTDKHTKIESISSGRLVRQLATDAEVQIRSISELLADEARNPKGLKLEDLKWGIQYDKKMATVNVSDRNTVYPPSDGTSLLGSVFLLVEAANGNYIPAYIRPIRLSEIKDGRLKNQINNNINELTSTDYNRRLAAIKQLVQILNLTQEGDNILIGTKEKPTVSIVSGGRVIRTFHLAEASFDRGGLLREIDGLNPRVNITTSALSSLDQLEMLDEAGALTTDLAKIGTSGASYNVYTMDADGNPIIKEPAQTEGPTLETRSDLAKAQKKMSSERIGNSTYRRDDKGNWYTETDKLVTDQRLIEQLNFRNMIRNKGTEADRVIGQDEVFIINPDKGNPCVLVRRRGNFIFAMTKEGALKTINEVNAELAEKARQERLQKEIEREASNDEVLRGMSEEAKKDAVGEGSEDVDLGETLTDEQIVDQMTGNFESEATPGQKTAEELVGKITDDTADIQLSEDVAPTKKEDKAPVVQPKTVRTGEDINKTGTKSLAELQNEKSTDTASSIIRSKQYGKRVRGLLKTKFPDLSGKMSEIEKFLQSKKIATTGITDVENWIKLIEGCK